MTPEAIERVLHDFRTWLQEAQAEPIPPKSTAPEGHRVDLHTLIGQFIALRHEVNLQTKAARAQQEQNGEALEQLREAFTALQQEESAELEAGQQRHEESTRRLLKTLVDVHDALQLAGREVQRSRGAVQASLDSLRAAPAEPPPVSRWPRWWRREPAAVPTSSEPPATAGVKAAAEVEGLIDALLAGYRMSVQRAERTLVQAGLEPIACVGQAFDPERMEVVAAVPDSGQPAGTVLEEVRRGYLWQGRVFRYAQVSVARG